jgi:hypothetical protein
MPRCRQCGGTVGGRLELCTVCFLTATAEGREALAEQDRVDDSKQRNKTQADQGGPRGIRLRD